MTAYAFSVLPYHIVLLVAKYVRQPKSELDMNDNGKEPVNPLVALLHVCHNWRQVTLPIMFGSGSISISEICRLNTVYARYYGSIIESFDQSYNAYMLKLYIDFILYEATHGKTLRLLSASGVGSFVFPSLRHVTISTRYRQESQLECPDANSNIRKLVQHICQMLPALESITIRYIGTNITMYINIDTFQSTNDMADKFSDTLSVIYFKINLLLADKPDCNLLIAGLTSLSIYWFADYNTVANILYANAPLLKNLCISYRSFEGIEKLVHCENSKQEYICYPQLTELTLLTTLSTPVNVVPPTGNAVIFPRLCKVDICFEFPFSDDVLFRGNRWTLESIDIVLNTEAIMQLGLDGVFNKGNMLALQDVVIRSNDETASNASINSCSKNFFQGLLLSSRYVTIQSQPYYEMLIGSIDCNTQHSKLICLHLGSRNVTFENIVVLLQALPRLSYLKSNILSLGNKYSGMPLPKVLKCMQTEFNPLSKSFNTWKIQNLDMTIVDLVTTCIVLLINQCPNFHTVVFNRVTYIAPIKIHQQLMRISPRISKLYSRKNEKPQFNISFAPNKAVIKMYHNTY